jgi:hypothetical protein
MNHFARLNSLYGPKQLFPDHLIVTKLILSNAHNHQPDPKPSNILLKLKLAVDRHQHVECVLSGRQQCPIFERAPPLVVNSSSQMIQEKGLDPWIYALVNKDAHSRI